MSYKIVVLHYKGMSQRPKSYVTDVEAVKGFQKKYAPNPRQGFLKVRKCASVDKPETVPPEKMPDPWLVDSEFLLNELARLREMILKIPAHNDSILPINNAID